MANKPRIEELDKNMAAEQVRADGGLRWLSAHAEVFTVDGLPWYREDRLFQRLPQRAKGVVRDPVFSLAQMPSGGRLRFKTDTPKLVARVQTPPRVMMNMCPVGHSGLDLYMGPPENSRIWQSVRPVPDALEKGQAYDFVLFEDLPEETRLREFTLYLPTYNALTDLQLGFAANARIEPPTPYRHAKPIVFYGTSITQCGCASRPGNGYPPILSRMLNADFVNLGFSGNGMGEPELAKLLAEIDAGAFVLDYEANAGLDRMRENLLPFCETLRKVHPHTPLVLVSRPYFGKVNYFYKCHRERQEALELYNSVAARINAGHPGTTVVVDGWTLIGPDSAEYAYVDGLHPNDYGFIKMAEGLAPVLRLFLK